MPIVNTIPDSRLTGFNDPAIEQVHTSVQEYVDALMGEIDHLEQIRRLPASGRPEITGAIVKDATLLLQRGIGTKRIGWLSAMITKGIRIVAALLSLFVGMMYDAAQLQNQDYLVLFILIITLTVMFNILSVRLAWPASTTFRCRECVLFCDSLPREGPFICRDSRASHQILIILVLLSGFYQHVDKGA